MVAAVTMVRKVAEEDRAQWMLLWVEWQAYVRGTVPPEASARSFDMMLDGGSRLASLLAFADSGPAVGFANISTTPFAWSGGPIVFLQDLFISEQWRGSGAGRALMDAVYAEADAIGAAQVFWFVDEADARLQGFYESLGMRTPYLRFMRKPWAW